MKLDIKTYEIRTDKLKSRKRPLRLVLLADLHNCLWGERQGRLLDAIDGLRPGFVLCAGDMLLGRRPADTGNALALFQGLSQRGHRVIAANGNHESRMRAHIGVYSAQYQDYADRLRELGVILLENKEYRTSCEGMPLSFYGYELPPAYYRKVFVRRFDARDLRDKLGLPNEDGFNVLIAHNPVYFKDYAAWGADLTVSGHLHGGIIRLPGIGGVITPQAKLFPRYDRGMYVRDGKYMAVSAGLGEHTVPVRIFNPRQLICIKIKGTG